MVCPSASAYYHFVHFLNRTGPYVPVIEKYDLSALPNRSINFYISEQGPSAFAPNDSLASVVSQIRNARFEPATRGGQPVEMCGYTLTVGWRMAGQTDPAAAGTP